MTADTETAIITGLFTLTGAAMGAVGSLWLERSKAKYEDRNAEVQARRTYRFDALKNLYVHVDPLLFRLQEPLETIVGHVTGVAREARAHRLLAPGGWHAADTYNLRAFVYRLAAPGAYYHLMQRSLSTVDLGLDPSTRTIYELMRAYVRLFRYDFRFADDIYGKDAAGADRYRPDRTADMLPAPGAQGAHFPQGIVLGLLDPMLDQLIVGKQERISSFGEIEIAYRNADAKTVEAMQAARRHRGRVHARGPPGVLGHRSGAGDRRQAGVAADRPARVGGRCEGAGRGVGGA